MAKVLFLFFSLILCFNVLASDNYKEIDFIKSSSSDLMPFVNQVKADAEKENPEAQFNLSVLFSRGIGVEKNPEKSRIWLRRAANNNNARANYFLGQNYLLGYSVEKNIPEAIKRFEVSANQGDVDSMQILGVIRYGLYGDSFVDVSLSEKYLKESSNHGNGAASFLLSCIYRYDIYDEYLANKYLMLSIEQGYRKAISYDKKKDLKYLKKQCKNHRM